MSYSIDDFFDDLNLTSTTTCDEFLEVIKRKVSSQNPRLESRAFDLAFAIINTICETVDKNELDAISEQIGLKNDSYVYILEKKNSHNVVLQAGILPQGCEIKFKNTFND